MERVVTQPRLQNGGPGEETLDEAAILDTPKNPRVFCHVRFKISPLSFEHKFQIAGKQTRLPIAERNLWKRPFIMDHVTKYSTILGVFWQHCFAILEERAVTFLWLVLGLIIFFFWTMVNTTHRVLTLTLAWRKKRTRYWRTTVEKLWSWH